MKKIELSKFVEISNGIFDSAISLLELFYDELQDQFPYCLKLHWAMKGALFTYGTEEFGDPIIVAPKENGVSEITIIFNLASKHLYMGIGPTFRYIYPVAKATFDFKNGEVVLKCTEMLRQ